MPSLPAIIAVSLCALGGGAPDDTQLSEFEDHPTTRESIHNAAVVDATAGFKQPMPPPRIAEPTGPAILLTPSGPPRLLKPSGARMVFMLASGPTILLPPSGPATVWMPSGPPLYRGPPLPVELPLVPIPKRP